MKYYLWIRWKNGIKDVFEITKQSANFWNKKTPSSEGIYRKLIHNNTFLLSTPDDNKIWIKGEQIVACKILTRQTNPLNDNNHYENPLS